MTPQRHHELENRGRIKPRNAIPLERGRITSDAPACLRGLDTNPECWTTRVRGVGNGYWRAIDSAEQQIALAQQIGQR